MKITILGCGGSLGVPQLGCECFVCTSSSPKNNRKRCSILIESENTTILVDSGPDFRQQALMHNISHIDAVVYTHAHYDHIAGIDDLKPFAYKHEGKILDTYMTAATKESLERSNFYAFAGHTVYNPFLRITEIDFYDDIKIGDIELQFFKQYHGKSFDSLGIRVGNVAYSTDMNGLPEQSLLKLAGLDCWIVDFLRYSWAPTHNCYEKASYWIERVKPKYAYLTHMSHEVDYEEINNLMPKNVTPAHDGLVIDLSKK